MDIIKSNCFCVVCFFLMLQPLCQQAANAGLVSDALILVGNSELVPLAPRVTVYDDTVASISVGNTYFSGLDSKGNHATTVFSGQAQAKADYGIIKVKESALLVNPVLNTIANPEYGSSTGVNTSGMPRTFEVRAFSGFNDTLNVGASGNIAYITFDFQISGHLEDGIVINDTSVYLLQQNGLFTPYQNIFFTFEKKEYNTKVTSNMIPVINNVAKFGFYINAMSYFTIDISDEGKTFSDSVDFFNTIVTSLVHAYDSFGNEISLLGATSGSGAIYSIADVAGGSTGVSIPEPAMMFILSPTLILLIVVKRCRTGFETCPSPADSRTIDADSRTIDADS